MGSLDRDGLMLLSLVARYLGGELSLSEFNEAVAPFVWKAQSLHPSVASIAYAVQLRLSERALGHLSEIELSEQLLPLVESYRIRSEPSVSSSTGSFQQTVQSAAI